ncbi:hypothetical protein [Aneurinibacillus migulanus]|uniref:Uncharacterized protein n=1 Tax=Aneurinibacillus migulanus TaxID=47500 RepID=A0A1G9CJK0_ANEMI|nr:hypothetical protein [Aneurinibacillus migulanus]MED0896169.1 hypothetical protein [Aneurinibacillus migulanus]MED1619791.1 hypothetical protein [Aneurinibacillus migulanus]GED17842.1 hypothetical protein AMI01nite_58330 [Aneurinibacillus migulanus]SDK51851.1 hypothetical protein SAMN04487909_16411 [Aneurinibacillus migulanus]
MKQLTIPLEDIKSIHYYPGPEKLSKDEKQCTFDVVLANFIKEKPTFEVEFYTPKEVKLIYRFKKKVVEVHLRPDEPQKFYDTLTAKLDKLNE